MIDWIIQNKEWAFSGLGVFILGLVFTLFNKNDKKNPNKMKQKSGANSTNIQIGGDYKNER